MDIVSNIQTFQFTINQDDSFQIDNVQVKTTWKDGTSFEDSQEPVKQLETAYANNLNFDHSKLNDTFVGKAAVGLAVLNFVALKALAKIKW